jgi:hypothetical protein
MSHELAQSEEDAEDYDLDALERHEHAKDLANGDGDPGTEGQIRLGEPSGARRVRDDDVVFEIGDEGSDKDEGEDERHGLIRGGRDQQNPVKDRTD